MGERAADSTAQSLTRGWEEYSGAEGRAPGPGREPRGRAVSPGRQQGGHRIVTGIVFELWKASKSVTRSSSWTSRPPHNSTTSSAGVHQTVLTSLSLANLEERTISDAPPTNPGPLTTHS